MEQVKVSLVIITYCQEDIVDAAVDAALSQDYPNLEVVFSDDVSPDGTFERLKARQAAYDGSHEFRVRQNDHNLGIVGNLCAAVAQTTGDLVVVGAGDDVSLPSRVKELARIWSAAQGDVTCLYSDAWTTDTAGARIGRVSRAVPETWLSAVDRQAFVIGASAAYDRRVFSDFPKIEGKVHSEDIVLYLRALLLGQVRHVQTPLVEWTESPSLWKGSEADRIKRTGEKNGRLRALAYGQVRTDYLAFCTAQGGPPDKALLRAVDGQIAEGAGFHALTEGRVGVWALGAMRRPALWRSHAKALRRYVKLRKG